MYIKRHQLTYIKSLRLVSTIARPRRAEGDWQQAQEQAAGALRCGSGPPHLQCIAARPNPGSESPHT